MKEFRTDWPAADYHRHEAMSSSGAKKMLRSPQHFMLMRETPSVPTAAMQFGSSVHAGVLEPATFAQTVVQAPDVDKRTKDGKALWAEFQAAHADAIILAPDDYDRARRCIDAVLAHPAAAQLLAGAQCEVSLLWDDGQHQVPCKARFDAWNHGGIVDLKTCQDASPDAFARSAASFLYHLQAAAYYSGAEHVLDRTPEFFVFIAAESEPPFGVACYALPTAAILAGSRLWERALERYSSALSGGSWEGYPPSISALPFPKWALRFDI